MKKHVAFWSAIGLVYALLSMIHLDKIGNWSGTLEEADDELEEILDCEMSSTQKTLFNGLCTGLTFVTLWAFWPIIVISRRVYELCDDVESETEWKHNKKSISKFSRYSIK